MNKGCESFWIIFRDIKFDTGSIKDKDVSQRRINLLSYGFCIFNHLLKHEFNIIYETEFEA